MITILHTADTHFSVKAEKLAEVVNVTTDIIHQAQMLRPTVAVLAGDTLDEFDGPIRLDSDAARAAIHFVAALADICPVLIVRGTRSHDRNSPYIFGELRTKFPIHVSTQIERVGLYKTGNYSNGFEWSQTEKDGPVSIFTCIPSPDKANLIAMFGGESRTVTSMQAREAIGDVLHAFGGMNELSNAPNILVSHGMITGCTFGAGGMMATGEDFEFSLDDLRNARFDLCCFGHIHEQQSFAGNIHYCGSPGRLNHGEKGDKGFLFHSLIGDNKKTEFMQTPARRLITIEEPWQSMALSLRTYDVLHSYDVAGTDVRVRYSIPEESKHLVSQQQVTDTLLSFGARSVKIEQTIIPTVRQRAAGISNLPTLAEKVKRWGQSNDITVPVGTIAIAEVIEGRETYELGIMAERNIMKEVSA